MIPVKTFFRTGISELISCGHLNLTVVDVGHLLSNLLSLTLCSLKVGDEQGYANPPIRAFFFAKSVDLPKVLFKSETTNKSGDRNVRVQRQTGKCECHC